jgi:hypothetical protein
VALEQTAEVRRLAAALAGGAAPDLEAWETLLLAAARQGGAGVLAGLLAHWQQTAPARAVRCDCGARMRSRGRRLKQLRTSLGTVPFARARYVCDQCPHTRFPEDERLDIRQTSYSPGVRRLMARAGSETDFGQAAADLRCYAGLDLDPREIERVSEDVGRQIEAWLTEEQVQARQTRPPLPASAPPIPKFYVSFDGTGVPVRRAELVGRRGKQADGSARTREAKLGCVFTQTGVDAEGRPQRELSSTTYVGAIESSMCFGWRLYAEAVRRGVDRAVQVIVLTDGARYNHTLVSTHFPNAIHIVDLFHAYEHLSQLAQWRWGPQTKAPAGWREALEAGDIPALVRRAGRRWPQTDTAREALRQGLHYFEENAVQMRYAWFRRQQLFVGSGVVEAGCRTVIGQRLKQSGMRWSVRGANAIIALRCCLMSDRFEDFWAARTT